MKKTIAKAKIGISKRKKAKFSVCSLDNDTLKFGKELFQQIFCNVNTSKFFFRLQYLLSMLYNELNFSDCKDSIEKL